MTDPVATITAALRADAEVVRVIGQNIANSSTAGYRRAVPTTVAAAAAQQEDGLDAAAQQAASLAPGAPEIGTFTDLTAGGRHEHRGAPRAAERRRGGF